jgi:uncharacterized protein YqeY
MNELLQRIKADRLTARKITDKDRFDKLRISLLTTLVGEAETALKGKQAAKFDMLSLVKKFYSNQEESLAIKYTEDGHTELCILNEYIPTQFTEEEIKRIIVTEMAASGRTLGKFMGHMNRFYKGQFDGKKASDTFKAFAGDIEIK